MKKEITIDAHQLSSTKEFYSEIHMALGVPSFYQHNLDDLWEALTNFLEGPVKIIIYGSKNLEHIFQSEYSTLYNILTDAPRQSSLLEILINP